MIHDDFDDPLPEFEEYMLMRVLLDTHAFLWWDLDDERLSDDCA